MKEFNQRINADAHRRFEEWRSRHPTGFVLNRLSAQVGMLHLARCIHLTFSSDDNVDLTRHPKWCADSEGEILDGAAEAQMRVSRCQSCLA
jgi:hypothetical protein